MWAYTWQHGRQLAGMSKAGTDISYRYDADGLRIFKTVNGTTYNYFYLGDQLTEMTWGSNRMHFTYDAVGPLSLCYNGTEYFYLKNAQGDVTGIADANGKQLVWYKYDEWGKLLRVYGSGSTTLGAANPLRYRGYVYDTETGLYYLQSRYYNPGWGRFINADGYLSTGQGFNGHNMFVYCGNNPVNREDSKGRWFSVVVGCVLGAVFGGISAYKNGENILAGVLIGGAVGALTGLVGKYAGLIKAGKWLVTGIKIAAGAALYAGGNVLNQYVNYKQQNNAKRRSGQKGTVRSQGSSAYEFAVGQSQAVADRAYAAETFVEYFDAESTIYAAVSGALFTGIGLGADKFLVPAAPGKGTGELVQHCLRKGMVSFDVSFGQFVFDARVAGN